MKLNKVLILSKPRFGSTTLVFQLGRLLQLPAISEPSDLNQIDVDKCVCKIIVGSKEQWENTNKQILSHDWDLVIILRRNENDAKISFSQLKKGNAQSSYINTPLKKIPDWIHQYYKNGEDIYQSVLGKNKYNNIIELTYDRLYNEDDSIREQELNKVVDTSKVHWLVKKNVLKKLHPRNRYQRQEPKSLI